MAKEYIEREAVLKYIEETNTDAEWMVNQYNADWIYSFLDSRPAADVKEVVRGEWISKRNYFYCAHCGNGIKLKYGERAASGYHFCPNCGADMRGRKE